MITLPYLNKTRPDQIACKQTFEELSKNPAIIEHWLKRRSTPHKVRDLKLKIGNSKFGTGDRS